MDIVINNIDIRRLIFTYLRKKPLLDCSFCKKVCKWDNDVIEYIEICKNCICFSCIRKSYNILKNI